MQITGTRCVLRPWRKSDAESIVTHANNASVAKQLRDRFPHPYTRAHAAGFISFATSADPPSNFAIIVDDKAVGGIGYVRGSDVERYSAEVGYWLGEAFWGRGIVTEALQLLTDYAFRELHLLRLFAVPLADNPGSVRVLEKCGYTFEGMLKASCVKYGVVRDQAMYARVNPEWQAPALDA